MKKAEKGKGAYWSSVVFNREVWKSLTSTVLFKQTERGESAKAPGGWVNMYKGTKR